MNKLRNPLFVVFFTVFVDLVGVGILIPVLPLLITDPEYPYYLLKGSTSLGTGFIIFGWLTASFTIMQFIATPILGQLSDHYGRKKILAISLLGTSLSYVAFAIGILLRNLPLLFIARAFDGITGGNIAVAQASIADFTAPEDRAKNFGLIGAAFGLGFILGPYLGGKLSDPSVLSWFNATTPFWFAAGLAFLNCLSVIFLFPETLRTASRAKIHIAQSLENIRKAISFKDLRALFSVSFLFQGGFTFFTTFFGVFLIVKFSFTQGEIGNYFAVIGIAIALTQAIITRFVHGRVPPRQILLLSFFALSLSFFVLHLAAAVWMLYVVAVFQAIFIGLINANLTALISSSGSTHNQGEVLGINSSIQALAQSIPPVVSGYLAATLNPSVPLIIASVLLFITGIIFALFLKPRQELVLLEPVNPASEF